MTRVNDAPPTGNGIAVISDIELNDSQKERILLMVSGRGHFDYEGNFRSGESVHAIKAVHFVSKEIEGVPGGGSTIDSLDGIRFEPSPCIYLEDTDGKMHGWSVALEVKQSSWHCGVIFDDEDGNLWFSGREDTSGESFTAGEPVLRRVRSTPSDDVLAQCGPLIGEIPSQGEFWLSQEEEAVVTSIPWWSTYGRDAIDETVNLREAEILEALRARVRDLISERAGPESMAL